jgi:hypothetical protein
MLLIIFLGLFVNLALVCGESRVGTRPVNNFDFIKVSINVLKSFTEQELKLLFGSYTGCFTTCRLYFRK